MLGIQCISPSAHIVPGQTKPFTGFLLGEAASLSGPQLVVYLLPPGAGVTLIGEGLSCFLTPGGLLLPRSEYGLAYWLRLGQAGVNMSEASGKPPSAWEEGPALPRCRGVAHPGDLLRSRLHGRGWGVTSALRSSLVSTAHQRRGHGGPATLGMICPKSRHKSLAQVGSARGPQTWQPPPESREQQRLVRKGRPLQGCTGHIVRGWVDPRALDVERGPTKGLGLP